MVFGTNTEKFLSKCTSYTHRLHWLWQLHSSILYSTPPVLLVNYNVCTRDHCVDQLWGQQTIFKKQQQPQSHQHLLHFKETQYPLVGRTSKQKLCNELLSLGTYVIVWAEKQIPCFNNCAIWRFSPCNYSTNHCTLWARPTLITLKTPACTYIIILTALHTDCVTYSEPIFVHLQHWCFMMKMNPLQD